ncbi:hypothetical protein HPG69_019071 [Diceros bicornis minor]|uniref:Uncharacterized protein n=1 Tax=Diceros bicornis minor TaxID=77932 RepID=A0A7J7EJ84_DICBM|nr:hypothetical protein HPG69_019071 [Diceros bicornis minor]
MSNIKTGSHGLFGTEVPGLRNGSRTYQRLKHVTLQKKRAVVTEGHKEHGEENACFMKRNHFPLLCIVLSEIYVKYQIGLTLTRAKQCVLGLLVLLLPVFILTDYILYKLAIILPRLRHYLAAAHIWSRIRSHAGCGVLLWFGLCHRGGLLCLHLQRGQPRALLESEQLLQERHAGGLHRGLSMGPALGISGQSILLLPQCRILGFCLHGLLSLTFFTNA